MDSLPHQVAMTMVTSRVLDEDEVGGVPYLVMRPVPGEPLGVWIPPLGISLEASTIEPRL